jgi:hypothetical protein
MRLAFAPCQSLPFLSLKLSTSSATFYPYLSSAELLAPHEQLSHSPLLPQCVWRLSFSAKAFANLAALSASVFAVLAVRFALPASSFSVFLHAAPARAEPVKLRACRV